MAMTESEQGAAPERILVSWGLLLVASLVPNKTQIGVYIGSGSASVAFSLSSSSRPEMVTWSQQGHTTVPLGALRPQISYLRRLTLHIPDALVKKKLKTVRCY